MSNSRSRLARELYLIRAVRDSAYDSVAAAVIPFADGSEVMAARPFAPGVETDRYLCPVSGEAHAYRVDAIEE